jgi:predicted HTH domain antitoxin
MPVLKHEVAEAYRIGRLTIREASDLLSTDYHTTQDILAEEGIPIADLTEAETKDRKQKTRKDEY